MKVLKITPTDWVRDTHDQRELSVCRELGADVSVMAKGNPGDDGREGSEDGFPVYYFSTRPLGTARWLRPLNQVLTLFIWGRKVARFQPDVISGHNLPGLFVGYLYNFGKQHKAKLVYDSHEFEMGRNADRSKFVIWFLGKLEKFLMKRSAFSIMVNDSIADEVQRIHKLPLRPVVARNIPNTWELDEEKIRQTRRELLESRGLPEDTFLVCFHGGVMRDRGIENMLRAVARLPGTAALVLGDGEEAYLQSIRELIAQQHIEDRTILHPAVPFAQLRNYVSAADLGAVMIIPKFRSYYFALPNKFMECIQSQTPVVVSDIPELVNLTERYGIGLKVDTENEDAVTEAIERMHTDKALYTRCKEGLVKAKQDLCWEKEKTVLMAAYQEIL